MKRRFLILSILLAFALCASCKKIDGPANPVKPGEIPQRSGESGISYQLLVYSFADSDGDGCGDFKGIESKLDYLKNLSVQAIWLSPIHKASSYHGYDVLDYSSINPKYGTEADFKSLLSAAHAKGIKIYMDYVLNHTSKDHPWFLEAKSDAGSKYRDYYIFSNDPRADISSGKIPMIATEGARGYDSGQWFSAVTGGTGANKVKFSLTLNASGKPSSLMVEKVSEISNSGTQNSGIYLYYGDGKMAQFYKQSKTLCTLSLELETSWGVLVRTSTTQWDSYKYGAPAGKNRLSWGEALSLSNTDNQDILMPEMSSMMYHSHFWTSYFADLNYGPAATCENSAAFISVCSSADKWIKMGVDGFRLDAIKHIYHNASSEENPIFLKKFYDHCNATYKAAGGDGDIYMVGEHFSDGKEVAPYYKGLPAFFDFSFWWNLKNDIQNGQGGGFVGTLQSYQKLYAANRSDYINATKLTNHDEDRAASDFGKDSRKMKLAAAVLLTANGEPYIYQGEELGYYGTKSGGDEYVRTPMLWDSSSSLASAELGGKLDHSMLTPQMSVEEQSRTDGSMLKFYLGFTELRDRYKALSKGSLIYCPSAASKPELSCWYRTYEDQTVLVIHNFSSGNVSLSLPKDKLTDMIGSNGEVNVSRQTLNIGPYASALFLQ